MKKLTLIVLLFFGGLTQAQINTSVLQCSCMHFETSGEISCSTGVSYTVIAGTGGCCSGTANTASIVTLSMNFTGITSMDYSEAPGDIGQFLCC